MSSIGRAPQNLSLNKIWFTPYLSVEKASPCLGEILRPSLLLGQLSALRTLSSTNTRSMSSPLIWRSTWKTSQKGKNQTQLMSSPSRARDLTYFCLRNSLNCLRNAELQRRKGCRKLRDTVKSSAITRRTI